MSGTPLDHDADTEVLDETVTLSAAMPENVTAAENPIKSRLVPVNVIDILSDEIDPLVIEGIEVEVE